MPNTLTPMATNLSPSGKTFTLSAQLSFDMGVHNVDRTPLIDLLASAIAFNQMIPFSLDVEADQTDVNLWEAPDEDLRARAVVIVCRYGGGGVLINPDGTPIPFPLTAGDGTKPGFLIYVNPSGNSVELTPDATGPGINKITVSTENESRFEGYVFI